VSGFAGATPGPLGPPLPPSWVLPAKGGETRCARARLSAVSGAPAPMLLFLLFISALSDYRVTLPCSMALPGRTLAATRAGSSARRGWRQRRCGSHFEGRNSRRRGRGAWPRRVVREARRHPLFGARLAGGCGAGDGGGVPHRPPYIVSMPKLETIGYAPASRDKPALSPATVTPHSNLGRQGVMRAPVGGDSHPLSRVTECRRRRGRDVNQG
jgi:hypothetical protein